MFLLDTNICIDFLDGRSEPLARRMADCFDELTISTITVAELSVGNRSSADPSGDARRIDVFVSSVEVVDFDLDDARAYGAIVRRIGVRRVSFDRLIGIQGVRRGLTLVTRNPRHFADVPGLVIEDWTA